MHKKEQKIEKKIFRNVLKVLRIAEFSHADACSDEVRICLQ